MEEVFPENGSKPKGHYAPGIISQGMLYVSGQLPLDSATGLLSDGGIREQTRTALANVERILQAADATREQVVQCRIYIPDAAYWDEVNAVYAEFFGEHKPARAIVPTRDLHGGALVEIEVVAEIN
jgi:2-iminobutanoate/2-iminopropanoate deaminase